MNVFTQLFWGEGGDVTFVSGELTMSCLQLSHPSAVCKTNMLKLCGDELQYFTTGVV
jgi:hypothetical protein